MRNIVVIIPTYNEAQNIVPIIARVREHAPDVRILVVDDNSPDGTAGIVRELMMNDTNIVLLCRKGKEGLGKAYLNAFAEVFKDPTVEWIQMMDADFSHDPKYLPGMFAASEHADVVIGSKYVPGGGTVGWIAWRRLLSRFANRYCRVITGMPVHDCTAGFILMRTSFMREAHLEGINAKGHAFMMELKYRLWKKGARIVEIPILLEDRQHGASKMSQGIILEGVLAPWRMRFGDAPRSFFTKHWGALLLALLLASCTYLSLFVGITSVPGFNGIYKQTADDQVYYQARARDVIDGHPFVSNPYIAEHKNEPPLQVWFADYALAKPLQLFSISVEQGYLLYDFLFVAVLFILVYAVAFELTGSVALGISTALFINCGLFIYDFIRTPSPQFYFVFWLLVAWFLLRYQRLHKSIDLVVATLSFGLLFNLYPYYWTYWTIALGLFIVLNFFFSNDKLYRYAGVVLVGGFVIGIPYFVSMWYAEHLPFYTETLLRISLVYTHFPSGLSIVAIGLGSLGVLGFVLWRRIATFDSRTLLLMSGIGAALIAVNQHLVTGQNFVFSSHYYIPGIVWSIFVIVWCLGAWLATLPRGRFKRGIQVLLIAIVVGSASVGIVHFVRTALMYTPRDVYKQNYAPIFAWLNTNTKKDAVVFADDQLSGLIPVYTGDNVYSDVYSIIFFMSDKEAQTRYILNHYWDAFTPAYVAENQIAIFGGRYNLAYAHRQSEIRVRQLLHLPVVPNVEIPDSVMRTFIGTTRDIQAGDFETQLKQYRVDYMIYDPRMDPTWRLDRYPFLKKEYEANGITIYKVL